MINEVKLQVILSCTLSMFRWFNQLGVKDDAYFSFKDAANQIIYGFLDYSFSYSSLKDK